MNTAAGIGSVARLIVRRDRLGLLVWVLATALLTLAFAALYKGLYPTLGDRQAYYVGTAKTPTIAALMGPAFSPDLGNLVTQRLGILYLWNGLVSLLLVIRHTRVEEQSGRRELIGSTAVGRQAPLAAALLVIAVANAGLGTLTALALLLTGLPATGAFAFGLALGVAGLALAAVGGLAAQLTAGAGASRGIAIGVLGVMYLLRAVGDAAGPDSAAHWVVWLSPIGWVEQSRPFAEERWWVFLAATAFSFVVAAFAVTISARRDLGAGLLQPRPGPAVSEKLTNAYALATRLQRGSLIAWTAGLAIVGAVLGGIAKSAGDALNTSGSGGFRETIQRMGGSTAITDAYLTAVMSILGLAAAAYAIQATLRLRGEEQSGRGELVLATATPRLRWAASHTVYAVLGPTCALAAAGLAAGLTYGASGGDVGHQVPRVLGSAVVQLPAVWVLGSAALALFGALPRLATTLSWAVLVACLLLGQLGTALKLSHIVLDLSPFTHIPKVLGHQATFLPSVVLMVIALVLSAIGLTRLRTRDLDLG